MAEEKSIHEDADLIADRLKLDAKQRERRNERRARHIWLWSGIIILLFMLAWWLWALGAFGVFGGE